MRSQSRDCEVNVKNPSARFKKDVLDVRDGALVQRDVFAKLHL